MGAKTNKSFTKRIKITRNGKFLVRKAGQNHFNAKASRSSQLDAKRGRVFHMSAKTIARNLPNI
ncbi:MAG: 50S ribosomal protein L35 [Patescibacteria group bacterium]